jgi:hypothetical protein
MINQPSKATLTLRNDDWKYTGKFNPQFYPMDGITIWLQRIANHPIQVFTGYIDSIPYYQAYPDVIDIKATCTLKKFMYTHFDPGVGFLNWLNNKGWAPKGNGNIDAFFNPDALSIDNGHIGNDSGMGQLLHDFLVEVGGLDQNSILIGDLPTTLPDTMLSAYTKRAYASKVSEKELITALKAFLSPTVSHGAESAPDLNSQFPTGIATNANTKDIKKLLKAVNDFRGVPKPTQQQVILAALVMSGLDANFSGNDPQHPANNGEGYFAATSAANPLNSMIGSSRRDPGAQGTSFCTVWKDHFKQSSTAGRPAPAVAAGLVAERMTDEMITQVAEVLAYAYNNRSNYYAQILESCRSAQNLSAVAQVIDHVNSNRNLDDIKTLDVITASEVAQNVDSLNVTWDELFQSSTVATESSGKISPAGMVINKEGYSTDQRAEISPSTIYTTDFTVVPNRTGSGDLIQNDLVPFFKNTPIKHSEIKYYVYGQKTSSSSTLRARFNESGIQKNQTIIVSKDGKSCECIYLGVYLFGSEDVNTVFTISKETLDALGIKNKNDKDVIKDVDFQFGTKTIKPEPKPTDTRDSYISSITSTLGPVASIGANQNLTSDINANDISVYNDHYKNANNRLAEYFYIASNQNYGLHLSKTGSQNKDKWELVLEGTDSQVAIKYLIDLGIISSTSTANSINVTAHPQSVPQSAYIFLPNRTCVGITFNGTTPKKSDATDVFQARFGTAASSPANPVVIIRADPDNNPKPVWNGAVVRLPSSTNTEPTQSPAAKGTGPQSWSELQRISTSAAFSTLTSFPFDLVGSSFLIGDKSLMNDVPIMQGVEQLSKGSMRHYMSLPNGMFCAFYPDYFGQFGRTPYMSIDDVEITDLNIVLNDESIVTHMYVNGNTTNPLNPSVNQIDQVLSVGVITIDDVFQKNGLNFISNPGQATGIQTAAEGSTPTISNVDLQNAATPENTPQFYDGIGAEAKAFLETYGTRPKVLNEPLIRSPWFEFVTAYNEFAYNWTMHTATTVGLVFMPELIAGGLITLADHGINMYVEAVTHTWNYETGFETSAYLSAPTTNREGEAPGLVIFGGQG